MMLLSNLAATDRLAQQIAPLLQTGDVLILQGNLGAGKTTFARSLLRALGVKGEVPSPTFTLVQTYETPSFAVHHFDLYRLQDPSELEELGFDESLVHGIAVVEWPERAAERLASDRLTPNRLTLHFVEDTTRGRTCQLQGRGNWAQRLKGIV